MAGRVYFHVVFTVWRGRPALNGEIELYFHELVRQIAQRRQYAIVAMETMPNHVHILIEKPPWEDISDIVKNIKGPTARYIFLRFPELRLDMQSNHLWTRGFEYVKHDEKSLPTVIAYIRSQKTNPKRP
jgi:putative transposase